MPEGRAPWYVIQSVAGREEHTRSLVLQAVELEERAAREQAGAAPATSTQGDGCTETRESDGANKAWSQGASGAQSSGTRTAGTQADERASGDQSSDEQIPATPILRECFVPLMRVGRKQQGKWLPAEETLLPGYLIAITEHPEALARALRRVDGLARVLTQDGTPIPLPKEETTWLETQTRRGRSAVEMSEGYVEDGVLHVTSGPLLGKEAWVRKVNHRKKVAYLEIEMFGRKVNAQLGIRITRNRDCKKKRTRE